jgi:hypothetical protein
MGRRTVAFGIAAVVAVTAAAIVTITNHRSSSPRHDATAIYIKRVDTIEQQMRLQLTKAARAYRDFAGGKIDASLEPDRIRAERTLRAFERQLVVVPAPPVAAHLKALLVKLARAQVQVSAEITVLADFAPKFSATLRAAAVAGNRLSAALAATVPPKTHELRGTKKQVAAAQRALRDATALAASEQADAVDAYNARIGRVQHTLARLHPPPIMRPAFVTQVRTLAMTRRAATDLARTLRGKDRSQVAVVGRRFTIAARGASSVSAQQLQISAVKAYNGRVRRIGAIQASIQAEIARLQQITD